MESDSSDKLMEKKLISRVEEGASAVEEVRVIRKYLLAALIEHTFGRSYLFCDMGSMQNFRRTLLLPFFSSSRLKQHKGSLQFYGLKKYKQLYRPLLLYRPTLTCGTHVSASSSHPHLFIFFLEGAGTCA